MLYSVKYTILMNYVSHFCKITYSRMDSELEYSYTIPVIVEKVEVVAVISGSVLRAEYYHFKLYLYDYQAS